jgi:DNA-binding transcriptional MerR regulator
MASNNKKEPIVTVKEAASGLSVHMVTYLARIDVLKPTYGGRGKPRRFTFTDILFLKLIGDYACEGDRGQTS